MNWEEVLNLPKWQRALMAIMLQYAIEHRLSKAGRTAPLRRPTLCSAISQAHLQILRNPPNEPQYQGWERWQLRLSEKALTDHIMHCLFPDSTVSAWLTLRATPRIPRQHLSHTNIQAFRKRWGQHLVDKLKQSCDN